MVTDTSNAYQALPSDSSQSAPRPAPPPRSSRTLRRVLIIALVALAALIAGGGWESSQPESRTQELLKQTGLVKPDLGLGRISKHRDLVTVVLNVGANDHGILEVMRAVLSMTVGPYELIGKSPYQIEYLSERGKLWADDAGVFNEPNDQSQRIASILVNHHIAAKVDRLGRGLKRYKAINATLDGGFAASASMRGVHEAKGSYVAILNANDQVVS